MPENTKEPYTAYNRVYSGIYVLKNKCKFAPENELFKYR